MGDAVKTHRLAQGLTQDQLAEYLGYFGLDWDQSAVARLEAGKKERLTFRQALQLMLALQVDAADLIAADDREKVELAPGHGIKADLLRNRIDSARQVRPGGIHDEPGLDTPDFRRAARSTGPGEAERKAARRLGVTPAAVMAAAQRLWGQRLPEEREARLAAEQPGDRSLQALRGHVTRQLLAELAPILEKETP